MASPRSARALPNHALGKAQVILVTARADLRAATVDHSSATVDLRAVAVDQRDVRVDRCAARNGLYRLYDARC
jgi:hypothetical protein